MIALRLPRRAIKAKVSEPVEHAELSPMAQQHKTVFISYRRNAAAFPARAIFQDLRDHGYDVFMDVESIDNGQFDTIILKQIEARAHFLLVLAPGTVERCIEPGDWLRREIEHAIDHGRNIVPLIISGFSFKGTDKYLTGKLSELPRYNGVEVPHNFFDEAMDRLRTRFLKRPVYLLPAIDEEETEPVAPEAPARSRTPVSVTDFAHRAYERLSNGDYDGAVADYSAAIRLSPRYVDAYYNRGFARASLGDVLGALADYQAYLDLGGGVQSGDQAKVEQAIRDLKKHVGI